MFRKLTIISIPLAQNSYNIYNKLPCVKYMGCTFFRQPQSGLKLDTKLTPSYVKYAKNRFTRKIIETCLSCWGCCLYRFNVGSLSRPRSITSPLPKLANSFFRRFGGFVVPLSAVIFFLSFFCRDGR